MRQALGTCAEFPNKDYEENQRQQADKSKDEVWYLRSKNIHEAVLNDLFLSADHRLILKAGRIAEVTQDAASVEGLPTDSVSADRAVPLIETGLAGAPVSHNCGGLCREVHFSGQTGFFKQHWAQIFHTVVSSRSQ